MCSRPRDLSIFANLGRAGTSWADGTLPQLISYLRWASESSSLVGRLPWTMLGITAATVACNEGRWEVIRC